MSQVPEWSGKYDEECRWHNKTISIHGEIVVNAMEQEMKAKANAVIWEISVLLAT
jgi:hypothetical protein